MGASASMARERGDRNQPDIDRAQSDIITMLHRLIRMPAAESRADSHQASHMRQMFRDNGRLMFGSSWRKLISWPRGITATDIFVVRVTTHDICQARNESFDRNNCRTSW